MQTVSVIIPTYNRRDLVPRAVRSVIDQTRPADEIIVVDDGSTDGTADALQSEFGPAITVIRQENKGVSAARNKGVSASTGDLLAFLDSDDFWTPDKLEIQLPLMEDPAVVFAATNWRYLECDLQTGFDDLPLGPGAATLDEPLALLSRFEGHRLILPTWIARREAFFKVGGFDERMRMSEDARLLFRLALEGMFAISPVVGTVRSTNLDSVSLTRPGDMNYLETVIPLEIEIFLEAYLQATKVSKRTLKQLRQAIAHRFRRLAEIAATAGLNGPARRRAVECLAFSPRFKDGLVATLIMLSPTLGLKTATTYKRLGRKQYPAA